jgi:hypothetical protein
MADTPVDAASVDEAALQEALKPLFDNRAELLAKEEKLVSELDGIKEARKRIEKILRAGGLLEPYRPGRASENGAGRQSSAEKAKQVSDRMVAIILTAAEEVAGKHDEFTIRMVAEKAGKDLATTKRCLEALREDHVLRLVGKKHPGGGVPDHVRSVHYALLDS